MARDYFLFEIWNKLEYHEKKAYKNFKIIATVK